jgi:transposase
VIGLPSLHSLDRAQAARIWLAAEPTDMRCGFDRLAERVRSVIGMDPQSSGHLFVFRSRRVFKLPRVQEGVRSMELRASELAMILDGIDVSKLKRVPRYERARSSK